MGSRPCAVARVTLPDTWLPPAIYQLLFRLLWSALRRRTGDAPPAAAGGAVSESEEQLQFERLLLALRLAFVAIAILPLLAHGQREGAPAAPARPRSAADSAA